MVIHSSSVFVVEEKSCVSRKAEITYGSFDSVGSIFANVSMFTKRRLTPWWLPKNEYIR